MIEKLKVTDLKCIDDIEISCSNYNLLIGTNSSGKSTLLQSLLILSQNLDYDYGLNGPLVSLGDFREVVNFNKASKRLSICVSDADGLIRFDMQDDEIYHITKQNDVLESVMSYEQGRFHYLSCNRIGGKDVYNKNMSRREGIGSNGEYAIHYLLKHGADELESELLRSKESFTLLFKVNYWLKYIINANIRIEDVLGTDIVKASYSLIEGKFLRPKNVGSGISFLIGIIAICLGSQKGDIIIIENPEIHLHPLSQSRLSEFLYFIAKAGRQVFVETHSDHLFNGVRVGIATKQIESSKVTINFIRLNDKYCSTNHKVEIGKNGKILNPIDDLFEQFEIDLDKMLGL